MESGQIYRYDDFYLSAKTGRYEPKYLVVLAFTPAGDGVARLLTSRAHGCPENPPCHHGDPYPGFYLGVLGFALGAKSWVDLRGLEDFDIGTLQRKQARHQVHLIVAVARAPLITLLDCAANADDTTRLQENSIRDQLAKLR